MSLKLALDNRSFNFGPIFIALAAFLWTTDAFVRGNLESSDPTKGFNSFQVVLLEHVIIMLILLPILMKSIPKLKAFSLKEWGALLTIGIGGSALATVALTEGFFRGEFPYQYVAVVILLQQTQPIIAIGFSKLLLKEKLPQFYYPLAIISVVSVYLIVFPFLTNYTNDLSGLSVILENYSTDDGVIASLLGLVAAFLWGTSTVMGRYLLNHSRTPIEYFEMTSYRFLIAFIFLVVWNLVTWNLPRVEPLFNPTISFSLLYIALVVGLLSLLLYYFGLRTTHASVATLFELAYPLSLFVLLPLFDLEFPSFIQLVGAGTLIIANTTLSYLYSKSEDGQQEIHS